MAQWVGMWGYFGEQQELESRMTPLEQQTKNANQQRGNAPVRVVVNGDRLDIQAYVDLRALKFFEDL